MHFSPTRLLAHFIAISCACFLVSGAPAFAQNSDLALKFEEQEKIIQTQEERIRRLEALVEELVGSTASERASTEGMQVGIEDVTLPIGHSFSIDLDKVFVDVDMGSMGAMTYSVSGNPSWMTLDWATGILGGTPRSATPGVTVTVTATDEGGMASSDEFVVTVSDNQPPQFEQSPSDLVVAEGASGSFGSPLRAVDPDGDEVTFSLKNDLFTISPGGQLSAKSGAQIDHEIARVHSLRVTATDSQGASTAQTVRVAVADMNEPPRLSAGLFEGAGGPFGGNGKYDPENSFFGPTARLVSADGRYSTGINGLLQLEAGSFDSKGFNGQDFSSGSKVRRGNLTLSSVIDRDWIMFLSYAFGDGGESPRNGLRAAAALYRGYSPLWLVAGLFGVSVGLESSTFSSATSMAERPMISNAFAYAPGAPLLGAVATHRGQQHYARLGLYGKGAAASSTNDEGWGVHGRFLWQPMKARGRSTAIGVSGYWRKPNNEDQRPAEAGVNVNSADYDFCDGSAANAPGPALATNVRFKTSGTSTIDGMNLVDTGQLCEVDSYSYVALEGIATIGPLSFQTEWGQAQVNRKSDRNDYTFDGGYVQGSYFLTGESKNYNAYFGQFWRVNPKRTLAQGGIGAWEVVARWQTIDLNDKDVSGGEASGYTLGINWYVNSFVKVLLSYGDLKVKGGKQCCVLNEVSAETEFQNYAGDVSEYLLRVQLEF